jgi:hypothetical protein
MINTEYLTPIDFSELENNTQSTGSTIEGDVYEVLDCTMGKSCIIVSQIWVSIDERAYIAAMDILEEILGMNKNNGLAIQLKALKAIELLEVPSYTENAIISTPIHRHIKCLE